MARRPATADRGRPARPDRHPARGARLLRPGDRAGRGVLPRHGGAVRGGHLRAHRGRAADPAAAPLVVPRRPAAHRRVDLAARAGRAVVAGRCSPSAGRSISAPRRSRPSWTPTDRLSRSGRGSCSSRLVQAECAAAGMVGRGCRGSRTPAPPSGSSHGGRWSEPGRSQIGRCRRDAWLARSRAASGPGAQRMPPGLLARCFVTPCAGPCAGAHLDHLFRWPRSAPLHADTDRGIRQSALPAGPKLSRRRGRRRRP